MGCTDQVESVREVRFSFDRKSLLQRFGSDPDRTRLEVPRLMVQEKRAVECARVLATECGAAEVGGGLYGEGLTLALLGITFKSAPYETRPHFPHTNSA